MSSFPAQSLATAIDRLPGLSAHLAYNYQELLERIEEESTCQAIRALLERSVKWQQRERQRRKRKSLIKNLFLH